MTKDYVMCDKISGICDWMEQNNNLDKAVSKREFIAFGRAISDSNNNARKITQGKLDVVSAKLNEVNNNIKYWIAGGAGAICLTLTFISLFVLR